MLTWAKYASPVNLAETFDILGKNNSLVGILRGYRLKGFFNEKE